MAPEKVLDAQIKDVQFGEGVRVVQPVNLYGCTIEKNCTIGPFCEIQNGVKIGSETKVQSHTFICEMVTIGANCFIGHGVMFTNDKFIDGAPANGDKQKWLSTTIGNNVSIGSGSVLLPVEICSNVVIGAGSVVTKDITIPGKYAGNPARRLK